MSVASTGPVVLFSGLPRSGKSTVAKRLAEDMEMKYASPGEVIKDLTDGKYMEVHKLLSEIPFEIVKEAVDTVMELIKEGNIVLDGRVEPVLCRQRAIHVPAVYYIADFEIRADRLAREENLPSYEEAEKILKKREYMEVSLCRNLFNGDFRDPDLYIGTIDTSYLSPDEAYEATTSLLREKGFLITPDD